MAITIYLVFFIFGTFDYVSSFKEVAHCSKEGNHSLICNFIPSNIQTGITNVKVDVTLKAVGHNFIVSTANFKSERWTNIDYFELDAHGGKYSGYLILNARCFQNLVNLKVLHIHSDSYVTLDPDTFTGLNYVTTLNMSGCIRLSLNDLIPSLKGKEKLPRLETLTLSKLYYYEDFITIDAPFTEEIKDKMIKHLDISITKISEINITAVVKNLRYLKTLNSSYSKVSFFRLNTGAEFDVFDSVDVLDVSHMQYMMIIPTGKIIFNARTFYTSGYTVKLLLSPKVINGSGITPKQVSLWFYNCTLNFDSGRSVNWNSEGIFSRANNIRYVDVKALCKLYKWHTIQYLDLAENGLEFLHPSIFPCMPNLLKLNLSYNKLFRMIQGTEFHFQNMFVTLLHLKVINLSGNDLRDMPRKVFDRNDQLEEIDLSKNHLTQVTFTLSSLKQLRILNLQHNDIMVLGVESLRNLDSVTHQHSGTHLHVCLKSNPVSCSKCDDKNFLQWLIRSSIVNITDQGLTCITEKGSRQIINSDTVAAVYNICRRKTIITSASVPSGFILLTTIVAVTIICIRKKRKRAFINRMNLIHDFREGQGQYEFVAFLSYCSHDEEFVQNYVREQLNESLKLLTEVDRDLVCIGDQHLRPGFFVLDESIRCIERASVVIAVVSNTYCTSNYCHHELDQAWRLNKPVVLMLKENVEEEVMMPTMKLLFKTNVRILWTVENGEYVLKTTWENVCTSILDLIVRRI